jgi:tetratricopeptide (TPR) repeat protein
MMMNCPSDETLAAFIDDRLDETARAQVIDHLSTCTACRDVVNAFHELDVETPGTRSWAIPAVTLAAAAAIAAALFLGPIGERFRVSRHMRALTAAAARLEERPIAARPSIDVAYKPRSAMRGADGEASADAQLLESAAAITEIADENPTGVNLQKAGVALLLANRFDRDAVRYLEKAQSEQKESDADLLNDLAAAYYETGNMAKAQSSIERAWASKRSAPIAWTRAVVLNTPQAWRDYLKIDPDSEWAAEARTRLENQIGN